jgi:hypothetical protein
MGTGHKKVCAMHDMIGSAGMLRGWVAVWTMQMLWLFASLTVAVGVVGVVETLVAEYRRRREVKIKPLTSALMNGCPNSPMA